jgi:hypothetical protein
MNVGGVKRFNWLPMQPAWKEMEVRRARRAEHIRQDQANIDAMNSAMADALQNRITQSSNLFAKAALGRVQTAAKAKNDEVLKQIDDAQKLIDKTTPAEKPEIVKSATSSVIDTVA